VSKGHSRVVGAPEGIVRARRVMMVLAGALIAIMLLVAGASDASAKSSAKVKVSVATITRAAVLKSGIKVTVTSPGKGKVSVSAGSVAKSASVTFKKRGKKSVSLKLSASGKKTLSACGTVTGKVTVTASYKGKKVKASKTYRLTGPVCPLHVAPADATRCDPLGYGQCMTPFPDDFYTVADPSTATGRRVNIAREAMPSNYKGKSVPRVHIDPAEWNRNDGFSLVGPINVQVPGLDSKAAFDASKIVPVTDMAQYARADQPVVLIDTVTKQRFPIWAEMDANATTNADRLLEIHPSKALTEGRRYIVALRNLKTAGGTVIPPSDVFRAYRDNLTTDNADVEARRSKMDSIFATLSAAGITRSNLNLAWDFTVASASSVTGRMLSIRNQAYAQLGDTNLTNGTVEGVSPQVTVTQVINLPNKIDDPVNGNEYGARQVAGTVKVPCFLTSVNCAPGGSFNYGPDGKTPVQSGTNSIEATFRCIIPRESINGPIATGTRAVMYGHGLFGTANQAWRSNKINYAFDSHLTICGAEFAGMADEDVVPTTVGIIQDLSGFKKMADRIQQGLLDFMFVGRSMVAPGGMSTKRAFQNGDGTTTDGTSVIDTAAKPAYFGISEGGILGGSLTAVDPDITNSVLNVPGMGYSTLLPRSTDFADFASLLYPSYPDQRSRPLVFSLMQMLWDRGEASGYSHHMTSSPLPGTPPHRVLMQVAFGDHQVANVTAETEARTLGLSTRTHLLDPGRSLDVSPFWGIPQIGSFPAQSSGITLWDAGPGRLEGAFPNRKVQGNSAAPTTNTAPVDGWDDHTNDPPPDGDGLFVNAAINNGRDPHGAPGDTPEARHQLGDFLNTGTITDTCLTGKPCYSRGYTGP